MSVPVTQTAGSLLTTLDSHKPILQRMLSPKAVALVGATEAPNSVGRTLMENLLSFGENLYPINPKRPTVLGVKAFPKIADVPATIDLAVIATPAFTAPDVISECEKAAVPGAVIISAGFKECGAAGIKLEEEILARKGPMRLIGPNCLGVMIPELGLNATFAKRMALRGNVAFISQRCALHIGIGLESSGAGWVQRLSLHRFDAGCRVGRPH